MSSEKISNEQIYQKLETHDLQMNLVVEMLKDQQKRISRLEHLQERLEDRVVRIEDRTQRLETKIDHIHVSWNNKLIGGTIATGAVVSGMVAFAVSSFF